MKRTLIVERLIEEKWKSRRKFAEHIGIPPTTLQSILKRGVGNASIDNVIKICKGLGITVEQLEEMGKAESVINESLGVYETKDLQTSEYRYYPTSISAGLPNGVEALTEKDVDMIKIPDSIMGKWAGDKDVFITRINGDSMNNIMEDGSLIAVKPIELSQLKNNDIVVYKFDNEYAVKRFFKDGNKIIFRPDSKDPTFTDLVINLDNLSDDQDLIIKGKVVLYIVEL